MHGPTGIGRGARNRFHGKANGIAADVAAAAVVTFTVHTMSAAALDTDQAKTIGAILVVGLIVLAVLISMIVKAILKRVVVIVLALVLAGVVYSQRVSIQSAARKCDATFFGTHLTPANPTLRKRCQRLTSR